jgi:hypothetical protein
VSMVYGEESRPANLHVSIWFLKERLSDAYASEIKEVAMGGR